MPFSKLKGKNLMLCDMLYQRPTKFSEYHDYMNVIYRDLDTGEKHLLTIEDPEIDIFVVKEEFRNFKKTRHYMSYDKCDKITCKYKDVFKTIADVMGPEGRDFLRQRSWSDRKLLYKYPYVLGADIDIEAFYRAKWFYELDNDSRKFVSKAFSDIEVDQINFEGAMAKDGECPINAITIIDKESMTSHTFLLRNPANPLIKQFEDNLDEFNKKVHEMFDESFGRLEYNIYMFDDELELLTQYFNLIHTLKRDFVLFWNMGFDIKYIISRLRVLGADPKLIMCHPDFKVDTLFYYEDTDPAYFDFDKRRDYFDISSYSHFVDQLIVYAGLRKSQGSLKANNLSAVAEREIQDTKVQYSEIGNIRTLPYVDYMLFVLYNIKDCLLQMGIENKCSDMDNMYMSSYTNCTMYKKVLRQTVSFRNFMYREFISKKLALGHNVNFDTQLEKDIRAYYKQSSDEDDDDDDDDETFEGAINGDPMLNDFEGLELFGKKSMFLFGDCIDFDFSAMYPNSITSFNIFAACMVGKLYIDGTFTPTYDEDAGKEFVEDMISNQLDHMGEKYFNLPNFEQINKMIEEKFLKGGH